MDPYGLRVWDEGNFSDIRVHVIDNETFRAIAGTEAPPTPIDAKVYSEHGLPWFDLYDEQRRDVDSSEVLTRAKTIAERDAELNRSMDRESLSINKEAIKKIRS